MMPFNMLADKVRGTIDRVIINKGDVPLSKKVANDLLLDGDCDEFVRKIIESCEWTSDFEALKKK